MGNCVHALPMKNVAWLLILDTRPAVHSVAVAMLLMNAATRWAQNTQFSK